MNCWVPSTLRKRSGNVRDKSSNWYVLKESIKGRETGGCVYSLGAVLSECINTKEADEQAWGPGK